MLGTGVLSTTGLIVGVLPSPWLNLALWSLGGVLALLGAYCYGVLLSHHPVSGGEGSLLRLFYSPSLGNVTGLLSFFVGFAVSNAATALTLGAYLQQGLMWLGVISGRPVSESALALLAVGLMTALHATQQERGMRVQTLIALTKFVMLCAIAGYGAFQVKWAHYGAPAPTAVLNASAFKSVSVVALWVVFAYSGWSAAIYAVSEFKTPRKTVPRALMIGASLVFALYMVLNFALLGVFETQEIAGVVPVVAMLVTRLFGSDMGGLFSLGVGLTLLSSIGVSSFAGPRVLHAVVSAMKQPQIPANDQVPKKWIWLQGALTAVFIVSGTFEQILSITGLMLGLFPVIAVLGLYRTKHWPVEKPPALAIYVAAPLFLALSGGILIFSTWQEPTTSLLVVSILIAFTMLAHLVERKFFTPRFL